ncbi:hypothetical protein DdX_10647 [Ditylenchus destructor]|uniref:Uncharacterized protein n=1 Tax=Ditylenchus destructor TaxID=166010 RepID=A0AAD4MYT5_9BILA|nr:hypothetical protein DdX_10647 [Ditylenchus destructor]
MTKLLVLLLLSLFSLSQCTWWSDYVFAVFPPNNSSTDKAPPLELKNLPPGQSGTGQSNSAKVVSKPPSVVGLMVYKAPMPAAAPAVSQNTATGAILSRPYPQHTALTLPTTTMTPAPKLVQQKTEEWREAGEKEALVKVAKFYAGTVDELQKALEERDAIIVDWEKTSEEQKQIIKKKATLSGLLILDVEKLIRINKDLLKVLSGVVKDRNAVENQLKIHALLVDIVREKLKVANAEIEKLQEDAKAKDAKHAKDLAAKDEQHAKDLKAKDDEHERQLAAAREIYMNTITSLRAELENANKTWFKDTCKWFSDYLNLLGSTLIGYGDKLAASEVGVSIYKLAERAELALKRAGNKAKGRFKAYISKPFLATLETHSRLIEQYYSQPIIGNRQYGHLTVNPVRMH